jgi:hypothetical protein
LIDDFEGFKNPVPKVTENIVEMAKQSWKWSHEM